MKKIISDYGKLLIPTLVIFLVVPFIFLFFSSEKEILDITLSWVMCPLLFVGTSFYLSYFEKVRWDYPIILFCGLLISFYMFSIVASGVALIFNLISGYIALLIGYLYSKKELKISEKKKYSKMEKVAFNIWVPLFTTLALENYYNFCTFRGIYLPLHIQSFLFALVLIGVFYLVFLFICGDTLKTNIVFSIFLLVLFIINQFRIFYTSDTFTLVDIMFVKTGGGGELGSLMDATLISGIKLLIVPTLIVIMLILWQCTISKRLIIKIKLKNRLILGVSSLTVLLLLILPIDVIDKGIINIFYNTSLPVDYSIPTSNTRYYRKFGVFSGMYGKYLENRRYEPDGYDKDELERVLSSAKKKDGTWGTPNVIAVFSESFWDLSKIEGIKFDKDVIGNFNALKNEGHLFEMISPSYAGVSANAEFELLTGGSLNYFSKGYIPYFQLYKDEKAREYPSVIREFNNNNYKTMVINATGKTMFNCEYVYGLMGVKERRHIYDELSGSDGYVSDDYMISEIIKELGKKDSDEKLFLLALTMGGHMPYYADKYDKYDIKITSSEYNKDVTDTVHSYAQGIYNADKELKRLYDYIKSIDEETIIVFFGDHLPYLQSSEGRDILEEVGLVRDDLEGIYNRYNTEALVLANYDIDFDDTKYISNDMLLTYVLNNMDIELSPYYSWLYSTKDVYGSSNYVISVDKTGKSYFTKGLKGEMKDMYELREKMQYMLFR